MSPLGALFFDQNTDRRMSQNLTTWPKILAKLDVSRLAEASCMRSYKLQNSVEARAHECLLCPTQMLNLTDPNRSKRLSRR